MDQRTVWNSIAKDWREFRQHPRQEASEFIKARKGLVLDIGCGSGRNLTKIDGTIICADFSHKMLEFARKKSMDDKLDAAFVMSNAIELPFSDNTFDSVVLANSLHCIKYNKHEKVMEEVVRVAKKGADIFVSVWNKDQPRFANAKRESMIPWTAGSKIYRYYYLYDSNELESLMKKFFKNVHVFGSHDKAFGKYSKDLIATGRARK